MKDEGHNNLEIRSYLLGSLTDEEEKQKIEESLFSDDDYLEEFSIEESELVQDYVDNRLSESERNSFETYYLTSEERRAKVRLARAVRHYVNDFAEKKQIEPQVAHEKSGKQSFIAFLKNFFSSPIYVGLSVLIIIAFTALFIRDYTKDSSLGENEKALASLNKAYESQRPLDSRISGFDFAPADNLRGGNDNVRGTIDKPAFDHAKMLFLNSVQKAPTAENQHGLARVYLAEKDFDAAIEQLQKAQKSAPENAEIWSDLGVAYLEKARRLASDENGKRLEYNSKALENIENALKLNPNLLAAHFNKALSLQELTAIEQARGAWQRYLELDSNSKWADEARRRLESLGTSRSQDKQPEEIFQEFLSSYRKGDDEAAWRVFTTNREMITGKLIPQQLAISFLNATNDQEKQEYLRALKKIGDLENKKSGDSYFSDVALFYAASSDQQQSLALEAQKLMLKGFNLWLDNEYQNSFETFRRAEDLFSRAGSEQEAKLGRYWAAASQYSMANLSEHRKVLEELADYCRQKGYKWFLAEIYVWLGVNAEESTEYSKAIEYHKKAAKICEEISDTYNLAKTLTILADEYARLKQYDRSLAALQKSLALSIDYPETSVRQKWRTFNTGAAIFYGLEKYSLASAFQMEILAIGDKTKDLTFSRDASLKLGVIYGQQQKYLEAIEFLNQSRNYAESLKEKPTAHKYLSEIYTQLGNFKRLSGDCAAALIDYDNAIKYSSAAYKPEEYAARKGRLLCYSAQKEETALGQEISALLNLFERNRSQITEEASRNTFFDNEQGVYDLAIDYEVSKGNHEQAFNYSETSSSRSLLDLLKHGSRASTDEQEINLRELAEPLPLDAVRKSIPDEVQIVKYAVLSDKVLIWLVSKNDYAVFYSQISSKELNLKINSYLESVTDRKSETFENEKKLSKELYQILVSPVAEKLDLSKEIVFVPDKFLFRLPFSALVAPETGKFLVEDFTSFYSPSANVFLQNSVKAEKVITGKQENILVVGDPAFDQNSFEDLPALPSAENEAKKIASIYGNTVPVTGKNATKEKVKVEFPKAEIVHFAGHYIVDAVSPMRSFLLLAGNGENAALSNYELMKDIPVSNTKLIVLSACQTGVERYYNGEGMIGSARTFLGMGVPLVIASQWQVDSETTEILMSKFHKYRKKDNLSSAIALRRAQLDMLGESDSENNKYREPFYWAAFAATGGYTKF